MELAEVLIVIPLIFYTKHLVELLNMKKRNEVKITNNRLDDLRKVAVKTMDEQKEFINLRYPKSKFKFDVYNMLVLMFFIIFMFVFFSLYAHLLTYVPFEIQLWHGIIFLIFFPLITNYILKRFGLQKMMVKIF